MTSEDIFVVSVFIFVIGVFVLLFISASNADAREEANCALYLDSVNANPDMFDGELEMDCKYGDEMKATDAAMIGVAAGMVMAK